jgi:WD40 repeat protein
MRQLKLGVGVLALLALAVFTATGDGQTDQLCTVERWQSVMAGESTFCMMEGIHDETVTTIGMDLDRNLLLTGGDDGAIKFWNYSTGELIRVLETDSPVWWIDLQPEGAVCFVTAHDDGTIKMWNTDTGELMNDWVGHDEAVYFAFFTDKRNIMTGSCGENGPAYCAMGEYKSWNLQGDETDFNQASAGWAWWGDVNPNGSGTWATSSCAVRSLLEYCERGEILIWDDENNFKRTVINSDTIISGDYSPDGQYIVGGTFFGIRQDTSPQLVLLDANTGQFKRSVQWAHTRSINMVKFHPDGEFLASASSDMHLKLWSVPDMKNIADQKLIGNNLRAVNFSPDGGLIFAGTCRQLSNFVCQSGDLYMFNTNAMMNE